MQTLAAGFTVKKTSKKALKNSKNWQIFLKGWHQEEMWCEWQKNVFYQNMSLQFQTYSVDHQTPDSSSTATAMFTGVKTNSGTLGFDAHIIENDETSIYNATEVESIMLHAQHAGKDTGFVTTTRITHATPARLHGITTMDYIDKDLRLFLAKSLGNLKVPYMRH